MIKDYSMCRPYVIPADCSQCICHMCFNHIPFGDCSLGLSLCPDNDSHCVPVAVCDAFTAGSLAENVQALQ